MERNSKTSSKRRRFQQQPEVANIVGARLRHIRTGLGLTQEQLAARCQVLGLNLSRGTLAKIEAQVRLLKAYELFIIAKVLKVPMERFYPEGFDALPTAVRGRRSTPGGSNV